MSARHVKKHRLQNGLQVFLNELPTALLQLCMKYIGLGFVCFVASIAIVIAYHAIQGFLFLLPVIWCGWKVVSTVKDWKAGKIEEKILICTNAIYNIGGGLIGQTYGKMMSKNVKVTFQSLDEENPVYYQYVIPAKKSVFQPNTPYALYTHKKYPEVIIAFLPF